MRPRVREGSGDVSRKLAEGFDASMLGDELFPEERGWVIGVVQKFGPGGDVVTRNAAVEVDLRATRVLSTRLCEDHGLALSH